MAASAEHPAQGLHGLSAFQADLARRLAAAVREPVRPGWMALSWRGVEVLLPLSDASEIVPPLPVQPLPHSRPWVQGVAGVRGAVVALIDWVEALGLPPAGGAVGPDGPAPTHWLILAPATGLPLALCVDRLPGLRGPAPLTPAAASVPWRNAWRDADGRVYPQMDAALIRDRIAPAGLHQPAWAPPPRTDHV